MSVGPRGRAPGNPGQDHRLKIGSPIKQAQIGAAWEFHQSPLVFCLSILFAFSNFRGEGKANASPLQIDRYLRLLPA